MILLLYTRKSYIHSEMITKNVAYNLEGMNEKDATWFIFPYLSLNDFETLQDLKRIFLFKWHSKIIRKYPVPYTSCFDRSYDKFWIMIFLQCLLRNASSEDDLMVNQATSDSWHFHWFLLHKYYGDGIFICLTFWTSVWDLLACFTFLLWLIDFQHRTSILAHDLL